MRTFERSKLLYADIIRFVSFIGDHQQLRPTTSVYKLAQQYHMDISLFERMLNNNLHSVTLTTQYRMRTEIANLIRPMIYKDLIDNENVHRYPNVIGMEKNLFFIDHNNLESAVSLALSNSSDKVRLSNGHLILPSGRKATKQRRKMHMNPSIWWHYAII